MKFISLILFIVFLLPVGSYASENISILPKPKEVVELKGSLQLSSNVAVYLDAKANLDEGYFTEILKEIGLKPQYTSNESKAKIIFKLDRLSDQNKEAYSIKVATPQAKEKLVMTGNSRSGLLYALQTVRQMTKVDGNKVVFPACIVNDAPAFAWRAFLFDESRHFHGVEQTKIVLDELARLKFNLLHWHLIDNHGWRLEIKKYPLLTEIGSKRNHSSLKANPNLTIEEWDKNHPERTYYTQDEIKELIDYAAKRGIDIMPEIEMPAHVSSSIYAYPWLGSLSRKENKEIFGDLYNVVDPNVEAFLQDVVDEVVEVFPYHVIHVGGDEANYAKFWEPWEPIGRFMKNNNITTYADLQIWFVNRMSKYINSKGRRAMAWNEATGDNVHKEENRAVSKSESLDKDIIVHFWKGDLDLVNKAIEQGHELVNSNSKHTYLDYSYKRTPFRKAYEFNPIPEGLSEENQKKILGFGSQMWTERVPTAERLYYQVFPRIAALAECGWMKNEDKDFEEFRVRLKKLEPIWIEKGFLKDQMSELDD